MKKLIYIFLFSFVLLCSCSQQGSKIITSIAETSLINISTQPQTTSTTEYSSSKQKFLEYLHEQDSQIKMDRIDWNWRLPEEIIEYGDYSIIQPSDHELYILAYVYPLDDTSIAIDEVKWINYEESKDDMLFEIVNEEEVKINYDYADDIKIYTFFPGTSVFYQIPLSFLSRQIEIMHINLYSVYIENGKVKAMLERYVP